MLKRCDQNDGMIKPYVAPDIYNCYIDIIFRIKEIEMTQKQVIDQLRKLTTKERLLIAEEALRLIHQDLESTNVVTAETITKNQLLAAAKNLFSDYGSDDELRSFTALDSEDFRAER